ncbi:MAG: thermonuclease family protein [Methanobacteriaceae archaeon]|jgi:micrococcal nuclease|nr:thermonuclease family protein [Candidatus Methanorudis spinitermitis]
MKKKKDLKQILFILFLVLALFSVFGKLFVGIDTNTIDNSNKGGKYINNSYNGTKSNLSNPNYEVSGLCDNVVDGDTIDVVGVGRVRLVGIDTPERGQPGYEEATNYVKSKCLGKTVYLDIDNAEPKDKYGRTLAIVYVDGININQELLKLGYAKVLYIPPSEFEKGLGVIY